MLPTTLAGLLRMWLSVIKKEGLRAFFFFTVNYMKMNIYYLRVHKYINHLIIKGIFYAEY